MSVVQAARTTHVLLRVIAGALLVQHGGQKLFGWFGGMGGVPGASVPLVSQMGLAGILEFFGGSAVALGLFTRPVAFLLSGELAVAYFQAHQANGLWPIQNHGELAVLYSFIFLFMAAHGAGGFSLDSLRRRGGAGMVEILPGPPPHVGLAGPGYPSSAEKEPLAPSAEREPWRRSS
jgi:putative oxidoreductase